MALLELVHIVLALFLWASMLKKTKIVFRTDNLALVGIINKRTSKDKQIMKLVRQFVLITKLHNIPFKALHIAGINNSIADSLSRFQSQRFRTLAPAANQFPATIPDNSFAVISDL
jgi:hypothetical protein